MYGARVALGTIVLAMAASPSAAAPRAAADGVTPRVALIRSSKAQPIEVAARALSEALQRQQPRVEVMSHLLPDTPRVPETLDQIEQARPDLILTFGSRATEAALGRSWDAPVVFSMVLYPAQAGFLRPGVTGVSLDVSADQQFRLLRRLLPGARTVGVLYDPDETGRVIADARPSAARFGFRLDAQPVEGPAEALGAIDHLARRVDALWAIADGNVFTPLTTGRMQLTALERRVPVLGLSASQVRTGALAAFTIDYADVGRQTADLVRRVLAQPSSGTLPVVTARKVGVIVNARTARRLGLRLDPAVTRQATEVVR